MKMITAIIRPEREKEVVTSLEKAGISSLTRMMVQGRGRQKGIRVGPVRYEELPKVLLWIAVGDTLADRAIDTIRISACTGNPGDGKIFVSSLIDVKTVRDCKPPPGEAAARQTS